MTAGVISKMSRVALGFAILLHLTAPLHAVSIPLIHYYTDAACPNLVYAERDGRLLRLDLYLPHSPSRAGAPLVIWLHGGGWAFGNRHRELFVHDLTAKGFAVASVDYRLANVAKFPAQLDDCRDALRWLRAHAAEYRLDRDRISLAGASAGAHLAALLALEEGRDRIRGVFLMYPPTDLTRYRGEKTNFGYISNLLGGTVASHRSLAKEASPFYHVRRDPPPFLLLHGDRDWLVPLAQSQALHRRLRAAGGSSRLVIARGKGHGFGLDEVQLERVAKWLARPSA